MIQENYHEKFNKIIRKDTKPSKKNTYALYEPAEIISPYVTLISYGKENILENILYESKNFFIRLQAKIEFRSSRKEKKEFNKALDNIMNYKLDIKPMPKIEKEKIEEETIEEETIVEEKAIISNDPKTLNDLFRHTISILNVSEEQLQEYYLDEICNVLENIFYNYQNADVEQLKEMLQYIEKYQKDGIYQLNEQNNKKIRKILSNLHLCLTEQLLNLVQNNDFGYQKVK